MMMLDENKLKGLHTSSEHFDEKYGKKNTPIREALRLVQRHIIMPRY